MPEDKYDFKVNQNQKVLQKIMHIAWAMVWHSQSLLGGREDRDWQTDTELRPINKSKQEMISKIEETFDKNS